MIKKRFALFTSLLAIILFLPLHMRGEWNDSIRYKAEVNSALSSGDHTPFWLVANRHGLSSLTRNNGYLRLAAFHDMDTTKHFTWGAGVDVAGCVRMGAPLFLQQAYGEVKYRCLNAMAGCKDFKSEWSNPALGTGGMLFSGNARAIPQVRLGIFDYADVWGCRGWLAIKGYIAYGKFADSHWIKNWSPEYPFSYKYTLGTLYHSKAIAFRVGNTREFPLQGELGLEMATEFGGTLYHNGHITEMPHGLSAWLKAFLPLHGGSNSAVEDQKNVEGNMLGCWNFAISWIPQADWRLKIYYQHYFEDHSMMTFDYIWKDGLYGVEAQLPRNPVVSDIVYEFLYTKDQAGAVYWDRTPEINEQVSGRDNYYNNYAYNGWQNRGMAIGCPLLLSPIYNARHQMAFLDNRVVAHTLGFRGEPSPQFGYLAKISYSRNWGTYDDPYDNVKTLVALLVQADYHPHRLKGWEASLAFGMDGGSLIGHNYGVMLSIKKTGWLFAPKHRKK